MFERLAKVYCFYGVQVAKVLVIIMLANNIARTIVITISLGIPNKTTKTPRVQQI